MVATPDLETALDGQLPLRMVDAARAQSALDQVASARTAEDLNERLAALARNLGYDYYSYVLADPRQAAEAGDASPMILCSYPAEWFQRYLRRRYATIDPVVTQGRGARLPFFWGSANFLNHLGPRPRRFFFEARDFGIVSGVTVPVHGPRGDWGLLSLSVRGPMQALKDRVSESYFLLQALAPLVHAQAMGRLSAAAATPAIRLTDGERICLDWTLRGKTAWEIAQIIGRSKPTVDYHIQKAMRKLDAANKHHAAFKAQQLGLL